MKIFRFAIVQIVIFLASAGIVNAQQVYDLNNFKGLRSEGAMPADLRMSLEELYSADKQRVRDYNDGKLRNRDKILAASYHISRIMASGRILYGDPITAMVNRIADTLLKDDPELRGQIRLYTIKSPEVNAFATGQGMIFVCTGLVAQVENEAQLAFIISHEIVHYLRKHSLEEMTRRKRDSDDIEAETQEMRDFIKYHNRSREMESEADSLGLALFYLNSPYSKNVTDGVFDVLQYGYLPFDEKPFDTTYFNSPYYTAASECFMRHVDPITAREDYNDSLSTHPNILKRRKATASVVGAATGGSDFVTMTDVQFEQVRALARLECVRQDIIYSDYVRAFYDCYLLQQLYPDNHYVELALCQSLYGLSKFKTYTNTSSVVDDYKDFEGEVQQCYYFFRRIKKEDLALITARQLWKSHNKYPDDRQIKEMADDIFTDLHVKYKWDVDFFSTEPPSEALQDTTTENLSKYERLKRKKNRQQKADIHSYAFTDYLMADTKFASYLSDHLKGKGAEDDAPELKHSNQLVYCPSYYVVSKVEGELNILKSDRGEGSLYGHVRDAAAKNGIGSLDFSDQSLRDISDAERYNEWVDLNEWVSEFWQTKGDFDMHFSMQPRMKTLGEKYDAGTINMSIVLNRENLVNRRGSNDIWYLWLLPLTPISINNMISHSEATFVYSVQIDSERGKQLKKSTYVYNLSDETARVRSSLFDHFLNIGQDTLTLTPGYMGSRLNIALSPSLGLGGTNMLMFFDSYSNGDKPSFFSYGVDAEVGFVVKRGRSLQLRGGFMPLRFINLENDASVLRFMNQMSFSIGWRVYTHLAPLGYYWQVGADAMMLKPRDKELFEPYYNAFGGHIKLGRNHIFKEHILFGYYVRYCLVASYLGDLMDNTDDFKINTLISNAFRLGVNIGFVK